MKCVVAQSFNEPNALENVGHVVHTAAFLSKFGGKHFQNLTEIPIDNTVRDSFDIRHCEYKKGDALFFVISPTDQ